MLVQFPRAEYGVGRKTKKKHKVRLSVVREPNGRLQRDEAEHAPTQVRRLRDAALRGMADARWGTELGRLFLNKKIESPMFAAGERWTKLATQYRQAIGTPRGLRSASLERGSLGAEPDPDSPAGAEVVTHDRMISQRFVRAHAALTKSGKLSEAAVRAVCERNECIGYFNLVNLTAGLSALAAHFRLTAPDSARTSVK